MGQSVSANLFFKSICASTLTLPPAPLSPHNIKRYYIFLPLPVNPKMGELIAVK